MFTFCSSFNSHDQYFFARPERMVSGQVAPPQLDLANEDLVRAHVHAVWLAETGQSLGRVAHAMCSTSKAPTRRSNSSRRSEPRSNPNTQSRALAHMRRAVLDAMADDLADAPWWSDQWLDRVLAHAPTALGRRVRPLA